MNDYNKRLINYIKRNKNKRDLFIANIEHVSQSGMTRYIKIGMVYKGEFVRVSHLFRDILGQNHNYQYDGVKANGCGMDMVFATLDNVMSEIIGEPSCQLKSVQNYVSF